MLKYLIYKKVVSKLLPLKYPLKISRIYIPREKHSRLVIELTTSHKNILYIWMKNTPFHADIFVYHLFKLRINTYTIESDPVTHLSFLIELLYRTE